MFTLWDYYKYVAIVTKCYIITCASVFPSMMYVLFQITKCVFFSTFLFYTTHMQYTLFIYGFYDINLSSFDKTRYLSEFKNNSDITWCFHILSIHVSFAHAEITICIISDAHTLSTTISCKIYYSFENILF